MSKGLVSIIIIVLPLAVLLGGNALAVALSGRELATEQINAGIGKTDKTGKDDRKPLARRWRYDVPAVQKHWGALQQSGIARERHYLQLDLALPLAIAAAFAGCLLTAWAWLGRPFHPVYLLLPVAVFVLADWTENVTLLGQLDRVAPGGVPTLQPERIHLASVATFVKNLVFRALYVYLLVMLAFVAFGAWKTRPGAGG
jgi:hypothetical protein